MKCSEELAKTCPLRGRRARSLEGARRSLRDGKSGVDELALPMKLVGVDELALLPVKVGEGLTSLLTLVSV